jgi:hypothetical protein
MGNFSRDTFNRLRHYVGVRLQQGVPIVDADWNEAEDIRRYELRAFLKWFAGNGVPMGNNGFRIVSAAADDDFIITGGDGTADGAGRCLVDGWDVINEADLNYTSQELYENLALAEDWGVDPLSGLTSSGADRTDTVYLDVWEREVDAEGDPDHLVNPVIGLETCVRLKREWVVRVAEGLDNAEMLPNYLETNALLREGHAYYPLAHLVWDASSEPPMSITDLRRIGLSLDSCYDFQQVVADAYGADYALDQDGEPNLKISLRGAINALFRGELPSTPAHQLSIGSPSSTHLYPRVVQQNSGDIWLFWLSNRSGDLAVWYKRYLQSNEGWEEEDTQLTTHVVQLARPFMISDTDGDIWAFWIVRSDEIEDIWYRRYHQSTGEWEEEALQLSSSTNTSEHPSPYAIADSHRDIWLFWASFNYDTSDHVLVYRRYNHTTEDWEEIKSLETADSFTYFSSALEDSNGDIWIFWEYNVHDGNEIWYRRYIRADEAWEECIRLTDSSENIDDVSVLEDDNRDIWVFFESDMSGENGIWCRRYVREDDVWEDRVQLTTNTENIIDTSVLKDKSGDIWVFWKLSEPIPNYKIWYKRYLYRHRRWEDDTRLTEESNAFFSFAALADLNGDIRVFWPAVGTDGSELYVNIWHKKLLPTI